MSRTRVWVFFRALVCLDEFAMTPFLRAGPLGGLFFA